jgi:hypothetical protein
MMLKEKPVLLAECFMFMRTDSSNLDALDGHGH